jgi:CHAT domain-containing protein
VSGIGAGDEQIGLARGFLQAGAGSVVVSLWPIDDRTTAALMHRFYGYLESGMRPAAAMRLSQADLRRTCPHPYHWASFLVIGRP